MGDYMLKSILNTHRNMMYEFMEVTGLDDMDYGFVFERCNICIFNSMDF